MADRSQVEISRERRRLIDWGRSFDVLIDGRPAGSIAPGETATFSLSPGRHEIQLKLDWGRSQPVAIDLDPGQTARLRCRPRANLLTDIYWITFGRNRYIDLGPVDD